MCRLDRSQFFSLSTERLLDDVDIDRAVPVHLSRTVYQATYNVSSLRTYGSPLLVLLSALRRIGDPIPMSTSV